MISLRRLAPRPLLLAVLAVLCLTVAPTVQAQSQEVTATAAATGTNPPAKPTDLEASAEHDSVTLTWTASTDQTVTHYAILRRNPDTDALGVFHVIESNAGPETSDNAGPETSYTDGSVSASSTYIYRVKSVSPTGVSQWSGYVKADTPAAPDPTLAPTTTSAPPPTTTSAPPPTTTSAPAPELVPAPEDLRPTGLTVSLVENRVTLSWTAPAEDAESVDGYEILRRRPFEGESTLATLVADTESTATAYTDATANEAGVRYVYRVKALRGDEVSLWSNFDRVDLPSDYEAPQEDEPESTSEDLAPTGLSAALVDGGGVALSWVAPVEDADSVTGYEVLRATGEGELATLVADTASTATAYSDATATVAGETYAYEVKAIRGEDRSQASGEAEVQVPHDPVDLAPTGLSAALVDGGGVALSWVAPAADADSVTGYEVLRATGEGELATLVADTASTATAYSDATATVAGETYAYEVKAIRGEDRSQASGEAEVQVPHDPVDLAPTELTAQILTVQILTASVVGQEDPAPQVSLTWTAPAADAGSVTGYEILRAAGEGEIATLVADTASTATFYIDATATDAGETYAYEVKAVRGEDRSQASGRAQVQVPHDPVDLAPSNLTAEKVDGGVNLSWDAPAADAGSVTGYEILRATGDGEITTLVDDTASTATAYRDATATDSEETYTYEVKAIRGEDRSRASGQAQVAPPAASVVAVCEFDAGGSDLAADTTTTCVLDVGGSVRGERGAVDDVDWYRVALQAGVTYQFDMRGKSTGGWQLVAGVPAYVSVGTLEDPKLLGVYDASGALVAGSDSEAAGTGKDSRIASFGPDADGVYYISASAEAAWTGTYELSLAVTAQDNAEDLTLAPSGLEVTMVRNRLTLSWTAPAADADSVTGYEILRAAGDAEPATLVADTQSTATTYRDDTATEAGVSYTYAVKALRGDKVSAESNRASYSLPDGYLASTKEAASKAFVDGFTIIGEPPEPQYDFSRSDLDPNTVDPVVDTRPIFVQTDQEQRQTIWTGQLVLDFNAAYEDTPGFTSGSLTPNTFIFNGTTYTVALISVQYGYDENFEYVYDVELWIAPALDAATYATWKFVRPGGEFNLADAVVGTETEGGQQYQSFEWLETDWDAGLGRPLTVSLTGVGGTVGSAELPDAGPPGIKLRWTTTRIFGFRDFDSIPVKAGFEIFRYERNLWGNFTSGDPRIDELLNCDIDRSDDTESCLNTPGVRGLRQSWTWTDETAQRGVSYLYTIKPYHEFYSTNGTSVWNGDLADVVSETVPEPAHRVRIYGPASNVSHRSSHPGEPGTPTNLRATQPNSGTCTDDCVRLDWDAAPNATKYVVFRVGQRTRETWVDNGLTYPQQRLYPADPDLTDTEWEDTSAEAGVNYGYRVAAFNADGLRSAADAVVGIETLGGTAVPNRVRDLSAVAALKGRVKNTAQTVGGDVSLNTSTRERFAQRFRIGPSSGKVGLRWIAVRFGEIQDVSTAPDVLEATVNAVSGSVPGTTVVCTLTDPAAYVSEEVNIYRASGCELDAGTAYFFVLKRTGGTKTIELAYTTSLSEDPGSTTGWGIADSRYQYDSSGTGSWSSANQVHLIEVIQIPSEAEVTLNWTAPNNMSDVPGATYEVQYRLDIPEKGEWDDDWKTLSSTVAANVTSYTHAIPLEKYYPRGGTTEPFEFVPTAEKSTLKIGDSDAENDLILPFGINYEYRVRGVKGADEGLPDDTTVRIPNQDGLPPVVIIELVDGGCFLWRHVTDAAGNDPDGYRVLVASTKRRFHQAKVVTNYLPHHVAHLIQENSGICNRSSYTGDEGWQGSDVGQHLPGEEFTWWIVVQAYNSDGIAKGDGTGGRRSHGSAEIFRFRETNHNDQETAPVRGSEAETID